jgi:hypothetical protein
MAQRWPSVGIAKKQDKKNEANNQEAVEVLVRK